MSSKLGKSVVVGASALAMAAVATPAHAAIYAHGTFAYSQSGVDVCTETYVDTTVGSAGCGVSLTISSFSFVVRNPDGSCSGVANATMTISSPSTPSAPSPVGRFVVTHGSGHFTGHATSGLFFAEGEAFRSGSVCKPEVLDTLDSFSGTYDLHA